MAVKKTTQARVAAEDPIETVQDLHSNPQLVQDYIEWKNDPRTRRYIRIVSEEVRPMLHQSLLLKLTGEMGCALYGNMAGCYWALRRLLHLDVMRPKMEDIQTDYAMNDVLASMGFLSSKKQEGGKDA